MAYYFDDDCPTSDHWKRLDNITSDADAIKEGEMRRNPKLNSIVYKDSDTGKTLITVKEWKVHE